MRCGPCLYLFGSFLASLTVLASPTLAQESVAKKTISLAPSSDWNIEYGQQRCRLSRMFGTGKDQHILYFEQAGPDEAFSMTMAGPQLQRFRQMFTHLAFDTDDGYPRLRSYWGQIRDLGPAATVIGQTLSQRTREAEGPEKASMTRILPAINLVKAAKIARVQFGHKGTALSFETGNLAPPLEALNTCSADFVRVWGLDPDQHAKFQTMAQLQNEAEIMREIKKSYPARARNKGEQALVQLIAIISDDGSVEECRIQETTQTNELKSNACEALDKALFTPARDREGQPMRSFFTRAINYEILEANAHG